MSIVQKYITNISAFQFIQLLRFATLFLIGIVFSRHYSKTEIGEYETLIFVASAVSFFWLRGVLQSFLALIKKNKTDQNSNIYFNVALIMVLFSAMAIVSLILFKNSISNLLTNHGELPYFNWLLVYLFFSTPSYLIEYIYLTLDKPKNIILYGIVSFGLQFFVLILPPLFNFPIIYSIIGLVAISFLRFSYLIILLVRYSRFQISLSFIKKHLNLAYPLIGSSLLSGSGQYIDGIIVTQMYDTANFAIFRYGARELPLVIIMANALSNSLIPNFSNLSFNDALAKLKKSATRLMHFLFPATMVFLVISNWLFQLFFTEEFSYSAKIFNIYLLLVIPRLLFPQTILIGRRYTSVMLWVSLAEIVINVSLSLLLIRTLGLWGVAFATLVANLFERVCHAIIVRIKYQTKISSYLSINWYLFYTLITLILYVLIDFVIFNK